MVVKIKKQPSKPKMLGMKSSTIKRMGWENDFLFVRFKDDSLYYYENVPEKLYDLFVSLNYLNSRCEDEQDMVSLGTLFHHMVKKHPTVYPCTKYIPAPSTLPTRTNMKKKDFKDLVGKTLNFYGVMDGDYFKVGRWTFQVIEDPSDGYRSYLSDIVQVDREDALHAHGIRPLAKVLILECCDEEIEDYPNNEHHITHKVDGWKFVDVKDGHIWLVMGTNNTDDYYPSFHFDYRPKVKQP